MVVMRVSLELAHFEDMVWLENLTTKRGGRNRKKCCRNNTHGNVKNSFNLVPLPNYKVFNAVTKLRWAWSHGVMDRSLSSGLEGCGFKSLPNLNISKFIWGFFQGKLRVVTWPKANWHHLVVDFSSPSVAKIPCC